MDWASIRSDLCLEPRQGCHNRHLGFIPVCRFDSIYRERQWLSTSDSLHYLRPKFIIDYMAKLEIPDDLMGYFHKTGAIAALGSHGVRFLAVSQNIDTDHENPTARLLLQILASVAEIERELIRERVCAGVRNAKRKGKQLGRKRVVFDRHRATEMHRAGSSVREIAKTLEVSVGTIHRLPKSAMANQNAQRPQSDMR